MTPPLAAPATNTHHAPLVSRRPPPPVQPTSVPTGGALPRRRNRHRPTPPPGSVLVERYLALRSTRLAERTIIAYRRELTAFAADVGGDTAVLAMTPEALALWFRARLRDAA